ncbi:hypothetical protein V493_07343 [Pseudogymnoascus sp. VKM F-4281 (FW-2241)]|nr:hypothetical protein V493_07343 [Pseudogymnoascus sp. VKM F-4281 (FW-2241)]
MAARSKNERGGKAPDDEKLNIPSFVRITNTSGFVIPASILNKAWIALSHQIAKRSEKVVRTVDNNFMVYFWNDVIGITPASPVTEDTMTSYASTVYDANVGHNFATCVIPEVFWQVNGYQTTRLEKKFGEKEGFVDLRIWVEGYDNESLGARHRLPSSNQPTITFINIGTTFGHTVWSTDFLYQRIKAHNETITRIFTQAPEAPQIGHDSIDTLCCKSSIDGEAPIISPTRDGLYQFVKDNHRFLIQTCLNKDTKDCITNMQDNNAGFPNFHNVSKLYHGLEVIPISSQGLSRLEPVKASTKRPKAKSGKNKRRKAKGKIDGVEQAGEASSELTKINNETSDVNLLEKATANKPQERVPEFISAGKGIITNQDQTTLQVAMTSRGQDTSPVKARSEDQAVQLSQDQTIPHIATLAKDTPVSVTALARDEATSLTTLSGNASVLVTTISATATSHIKTTAPPPTVALVIVTSQATFPVSQVTTAAGAGSNRTGAQIASAHRSQSISEDRARVIAELRAQPPPPSLEEARARRASIKEERRQSIEFIRMRTSTRASALALSKALASSGPLSETTTTNKPMSPPRVLELVSEGASDGAGSLENPQPKRGKWIAPLPEQQVWDSPAATTASSGPEKKKKKNRRDAKSVMTSGQSRKSVGTQTETGPTSCSTGTQTELGVTTSIAEDLVPGVGPVPSREDESAGHGNTKPPPSVTSRASLQRNLELTSIVEDPALEQDCGGEYARGILTMAAPSTAHSHLVAELTEAGVPASALTSLSRFGLEANEASGGHQPPVGIHLEIETVTIGGVTFEAPRRRGSRHRIAASMPRLDLDW